MSVPSFVAERTNLFPGAGVVPALQVPEEGRLAEWTGWFDPDLHSLVAFTFDFLDGHGKPAQAHAGREDTSDPKLIQSSYSPKTGLTGFRIFSGGGGIHRLEIEESGGEVAALGQDATGESAAYSFPIGANEGASVSGIQIQTESDGRLLAIELEYRRLGPVDLGANLKRRWVPSVKLGHTPDENIEPGRDRAAYVSYQDQEVFRIDQDGLDLRITDLGGRVETLHYERRDPNQFSVGLFSSANDPSVRVSESSIRFSHRGELNPQREYVKLDDSTEFVDWSGTFNQSGRSEFDEYFARGFHIYTANPLALHGPDGRGDVIFRKPPPASKEYHFEDASGNSHIPTPFGIYRKSNRTSVENGVTHETGSASSFAVQASISIGIKASIPIAKRTMNAEFHTSAERSSSAEGGSTFKTGAIFSHDFILDFSRVQFASEENGFLHDLAVLCSDEIDQRAEEQRYDAFADKYGTHFAYAIRFGAKWIYRRFYSKSSMESKLGFGGSLEQDASINIAKVFSVGIKAKVSGDYSSTHSESSNDDHYEFTTIGGEASANEGFSMAGHPVPIAVDLRPIPELLNPVYFTGFMEPGNSAQVDEDERFPPAYREVLFTKVRQGIQAAIERMESRYAGNFREFSTVDVRPAVVEVTLKLVTFLPEFQDTTIEPNYRAVRFYIEAGQGVAQILEAGQTEPSPILPTTFHRGDGLTESSDVGVRRFRLLPSATRLSNVAYGAQMEDGVKVGLGCLLKDVTPEGRDVYLGGGVSRCNFTYHLRSIGGPLRFQPYPLSVVGIGAEVLVEPITVLPNGDLVLFKTNGTGSGRVEVHTYRAANGWSEINTTGTTHNSTPIGQMGGFRRMFSAGMTSDGVPWFFKKNGTGTRSLEIHRVKAVNSLAPELEFLTEMGTNQGELSPEAIVTVSPDGGCLFSLEPAAQQLILLQQPLQGGGTAVTHNNVAIPTDARLLALGLYGPIPDIADVGNWDLVVVYREPHREDPILRVLSRRYGYSAVEREGVIPIGNTEANVAIQTTSDRDTGGLFVFHSGEGGKLLIEPWKAY